MVRDSSLGPRKGGSFSTRDLASERTKFFEVEKLGQHQALTPEGFLTITDATLCRTGVLVYSDQELMGTGVEPGQDGRIRIHRAEEDVFHPNHIASFSGKPIANDHPPENVEPGNWKEYTVGTVMNPRRGVGAQSDLLLADLIIYDKAAIHDIQDGKRELSCGYDADYVPLGPGEGKQVNLIANHLAMVESGRCGPRCAIGDRKCSADAAQLKGVTEMSWIDKVKAAFAAKDEKAFNAALEEAPAKVKNGSAEDLVRAVGMDSLRATVGDEMPGGGHEIHIHGGGEGPGRTEFDKHVRDNAEEHKQFHERLNALEADKKTRDEKEPPGVDPEERGTGEEEPSGTGDDKRMKDKRGGAKDSLGLTASFQEAVAGAEILMPGIRVPTFDRAASEKTTHDAICELRRRALEGAYSTSPELRVAIEELNGGRQITFDASTKCEVIRSLFRGAVVAKKVMVNAATSRTSDGSARVSVNVGAAHRTLADLNKLHAEHYAKL